MRTSILRNGAAVSLAALIAGGAWAQTPPQALSDAAGAVFEGEIGGMSIWSVPGIPELFAVTPDGRTIVKGSIFSGTGRDIGSAYMGTAPNLLLPSVSTEQGSVERVGDISGEPSPIDAERLSPTSPVFETSGFADLRGPNSCQSPIQGAGPAFGAPSVAGWDTEGRGNPPRAEEAPLDATGMVDGAAVARSAEEALEGFDAEERREILLALVERLRTATTQEEFLQSIADWRVEIDQVRTDKGMPSLYTQDGSAPLPPVAEALVMTTLAPPAITTTVLSDEPSVSTVPMIAPPAITVTPLEPASLEASLEEQLLEDARKNALWFSVGSNEAPVVYAFIDPTCPYSARGIAAVSDQIGAGTLQLRVILAPVVSERAAGLIAGILTAEKPPLAFFDHEISLFERGSSDLDSGEFTELPPLVQAGIKRNYDMIRNYRIPGVPFFVYETAEGARVVSGAPEGIGFPGALVDPYNGTK